jgi:hypothetical protein
MITFRVKTYECCVGWRTEIVSANVDWMEPGSCLEDKPGGAFLSICKDGFETREQAREALRLYKRDHSHIKVIGGLH